MEVTKLNYLIPYVRLRIGDTNSDSYRYTTSWVQTALLASITTLGNWWNIKYLVNSDEEIYRNTNVSFAFTEPPVIEPQDNQVIVLMAAYIILEGSLENAAWDFASWRDYEISYSNLESSRARSSTLDRLWAELTATMKVPTKRLARALTYPLPGYLNNPYEIGNMK